MVNKRLLIKNILANNDECTFFDKKEELDLRSDRGKGKLLKHICALSNANPNNDSFLIIGISKTNTIVGIDFIDDADIQNLVNSHLSNAPIIKFENVFFPDIPREKGVGLLTIKANTEITCFSKAVSSIKVGAIYNRIGSKSEPIIDKISVNEENKKIVDDTYKYSRNSVKVLLDSIFIFYNSWHKEYNPQYLVYEDQFVLCWSGYKSGDFYSEVDIQIINEGVRLFFSAIKDVKIISTLSTFEIIQYHSIGYDKNYERYPFESTIIKFEDNGTYAIEKHFIFKPPAFPKEEIHLLYEKAKIFENKILLKEVLTTSDIEFGEGIANYFFICYLNGIEKARDDFYNSWNYLDGTAALWHRECKEILENYERL